MLILTCASAPLPWTCGGDPRKTTHGYMPDLSAALCLWACCEEAVWASVTSPLFRTRVCTLLVAGAGSYSLQELVVNFPGICKSVVRPRKLQTLQPLPLTLQPVVKNSPALLHLSMFSCLLPWQKSLRMWNWLILFLENQEDRGVKWLPCGPPVCGMA